MITLLPSQGDFCATAIFRFTAVEFDSLYDQAGSLFEKPVWLRPDTSEKVVLFE